MSVYTIDPTINNSQLTQTEADLYGSRRIGIFRVTRDVHRNSIIYFSNNINTFTRGNKFFELTNHLGNVLATISDKKLQIQNPNNLGQVLAYTADIIGANDYYPFGMAMPGRQFTQVNNNAYCYGFNGKENDKDISEGGQDYGMRIYDARLGRFLSVDPLAHKLPEWSPYAAMGDNPISNVDPDGAYFVDAQGRRALSVDKKGKIHYTKYATADIKRVANALNLTATGRAQLRKVDQSDIKVKVKISADSKIEKKDDGTHYTYGETVQGNYNSKDNYGRKVNADGTYGIKEATIAINEGTITDDAKTKDPKHPGLNTEQAIGAVAGHEIVHATDKGEINKDLKAEQAGGKKAKTRGTEREIKPNEIETKIINQSKKLNE